MINKWIARRDFMAGLARFGVLSTAFPTALWQMAQARREINKAMIAEAASVAGLEFDEKQQEMMLEDLRNRLKAYDAIHDLHISNTVPPALVFDPVLPGMKYQEAKKPPKLAHIADPEVPKNIEDVAFYSARQLGELVRRKKITSVALTDMYLERLKRYDPVLKFVITLTEDRARAKAKEADADLARGKHHGPLHGLPWGAKDLLAVKGYRTTWGAGGFEQQTIDEDATVVKRLDAAGAVLVAKLTLGALAQGDVWYGGMTRNPWKTDQGSSGSSAGPASATAAGCVAFSVGSETLGSISSPSTRCGCTGLRPTFGFVPRTGAMALSWSMDKLGPICRSVEDCAMVLDAIHGPDGRDRTVQDAAFTWDANLDWKRLRIGYLKDDFEPKPPEEKAEEEKPAATAEEQLKRDAAKRRREANQARTAYDKRYNDAAIEKLKNMGVNLIPVAMSKFPYDAMVAMLEAEAAAAFDELTRTGRDKLLTEQGPGDWPNSFRCARFIPAVEYIQASRARQMAMEAVAKVFNGVDVIVAPTFSEQLVITNLTGHPALILPNGLRGEDAPPPLDHGDATRDNVAGPGTPVSLTFLGQLYGEGKLLALARAYQEATGFHKLHPKLD